MYADRKRQLLTHFFQCIAADVHTALLATAPLAESNISTAFNKHTLLLQYCQIRLYHTALK